MRRFSFLLPLLLLAGMSQATSSTFDHDAEGWRTANVDFVNAPTTVTNYLAATWSGVEGVPAGSLVRGDEGVDTGNDWRFFVAPDAYLGDRSDTFGSALQYDTRTTQSDGVAYPAAILRSGTTYLYALTTPPSAAWTHVSIPLVGAAWSLTDSGTGVVSDSLLKSVLTNLDGLYVEADWYGYPTETAGLDNVRLEAVPEPACLVALGLGTLGVARRRGRRSTP